MMADTVVVPWVKGGINHPVATGIRARPFQEFRPISIAGLTFRSQYRRGPGKKSLVTSGSLRYRCVGPSGTEAPLVGATPHTNDEYTTDLACRTRLARASTPGFARFIDRRGRYSRHVSAFVGAGIERMADGIHPSARAVPDRRAA